MISKAPRPRGSLDVEASKNYKGNKSPFHKKYQKVNVMTPKKNMRVELGKVRVNYQNLF